MIAVHRITQPDHELYVNPDLIQVDRGEPGHRDRAHERHQVRRLRDARRGRRARARVARVHRRRRRAPRPRDRPPRRASAGWPRWSSCPRDTAMQTESPATQADYLHSYATRRHGRPQSPRRNGYDMKAITAIGIGVRVRRALRSAPSWRATNPVAFLNIPALILIIRRHRRRDDGLDELSRVHDRAQGSPSCRSRARRSTPPAPSARWSSSPRRRAATACSRSRRTSPRSTTRSPARACSWSSTAPTPTSSRAILESEIDGMAARHAQERQAVRDRRRLRADARHHRHRHGPGPRAREPGRRRPTLGPAISGAFIATLYGVGSANLIFLPIGNKLKEMSASRGQPPHDDPRGDPLDPGRRQPARAVREARDVRRRRPTAAAEQTAEDGAALGGAAGGGVSGGTHAAAAAGAAGTAAAGTRAATSAGS